MYPDVIGERKCVLEPSHNDFESHSVCNPTVIKHDGKVHIFYRAIRAPNFSTVGHGIIEDDGTITRDSEPIIIPSLPEEREGVEDPRIVKIESTFYMLYTGWDGSSARVIAAKSADLKKWEKIGVISPNMPIKEVLTHEKNHLYRYKGLQQMAHWGSHVAIWDKDAVLLPEKIKGKFVMLHRFNPCIQIVYFDSFKDLQDDEFWFEYFKDLSKSTVMYPEYWWESEKIGSGSTPIKTKKGWLVFHHGLDREGTYRGSAYLLDLQDPQKVLGRLKEPLFEGKYDWEVNGIVNNVVFPQGVDEKNKAFHVYYGCADKRIGMIEVFKDKLLAALLEKE